MTRRISNVLSVTRWQQRL